MRKTLMAVAVGFAMSLGTTVAGAATMDQLFFPGQVNQLSDNSGEDWIDLDQNGVLSQGDLLRGTFDWGTIEDQTGGGGVRTVGASGNSGLEGLFVTEVKTVSNVRIDPVSGQQVADFTFGANAAFEALYGAGAVIAMYEDTTPDYDRTGTIANAEALVLEGQTPADADWIWGFAGDADEVWAATGAPTNPDIFRQIPLGTALGAFTFQLSILFENWTYDFGQVACLPRIGGNGLCDINASGSVLGTAGTGPGGLIPNDDQNKYPVFDNIDATFFVKVPEPGSLALLGLGLLALGRIHRRKLA